MVTPDAPLGNRPHPLPISGDLEVSGGGRVPRGGSHPCILSSEPFAYRTRVGFDRGIGTATQRWIAEVGAHARAGGRDGLPGAAASFAKL